MPLHGGESPAYEKQREKRRLTAAKTFGDMTSRDMLPAFKSRLLTEIRADDLRALCNKVKARGAPATAVHVRDIVKQVFAFAILHGEKVDILRFRHLLEAHDLAVEMLRVVNDILQAKGLMLRTGTAVDATLIAAPSSTKNAEGERDPEMHQVKKGNQWYFGMKAHIGVGAASGLVHTVVGTAANVSDINVAGALLHGEEHAAFGDSGYQGVHKRAEAAGRPGTWRCARASAGG